MTDKAPGVASSPILTKGATYRQHLPCALDEFDQCDREFAQEEGDWALVSLKRIRVCGFFQFTGQKAVFPGGLGVQGAGNARFFFKLDDIPNIRCGMPLWLKGCRYEVMTDPELRNGFHYVDLNDCRPCIER